MARTGPQKIPGASQAYFYGDGRYSGSAMEVNCGVVHTTEGRSLPSYNGGAMAPTVTGVPDIKARRIRWYQHYDVDESARALANKLGGVETNTANVFQIELVGTCDAKKSTVWDGKRAGVDYIYWPGAEDWALAEVAWLVRWLHDYHDVPLTCVKDWLAYGKDPRRPGVTPASYGASPARMPMSAWRSFTGWCGHQHVPENDHGDPGSMNFARVIQIAKGDSIQEEDVPLTNDDVRKIWLSDGFVANPNQATAKDNPYIAPATGLRNIESVVRRTEAKLAALQETNDKLVQAVATLAANVGDLDPAAIVAELKAAIENVTIRLDADGAS
ncbi:hypothetical protein [Streptomyces bullii]|uniref:N-acetylmuramoyl-L-alanine amidase n=1 Tax=Streptomyces bullii TaxID=349910 RepID=A0ABW0UNK4_9ACTN